MLGGGRVIAGGTWASPKGVPVSFQLGRYPLKSQSITFS